MARHPRRQTADVAIVGQLPPPVHGSAVMTERLASTLTGLGHGVRVVDKRFSTSADDVGRFRLAKLFAIPSLLLRIAHARPGTATVYFLTDRPASFVIDALGVAVTRGPIIHYLHTSGFEALADRGSAWRWAVRRVLRRAKTIVVLGDSLVPAISRLAPDCQVAVIPNSVPDTTVRPIDLPAVRVLFMSNLLPEKGVDTFIAMARRLVFDYPDVPWRFDVAGSGELNGIEVSDLPLTMHGQFDPTSRDRLLAEASLLVFPSRYRLEAQPLTIIEAMAAGVPAVAFDIGGIRDLIPVDTGRLIAPGDLAELVTTVAQLGSNDMKLATASAEARRRYEQHHSTDTFADSWKRAFSSLTNGSTFSANEQPVTRVVILQDYVPQYRVPLFEQMIARAPQYGLEIVVASGDVSAGDQRSRNDAARLTTNQVPLLQSEWKAFGKRLVLRRTRQAIAGADIVVFEQARRNLDLYAALIRKQLGFATPKIALWGHGGSYVKNETAGERRLRGLLTRSADWFFAYTPAGSEEVKALGQDPARVTTLFNTIDTVRLHDTVTSLTKSEIVAFRDQHGLTEHTVIYLGALDRSKGINDLLALANKCASQDSDFRLLVAGDGEALPDVEQAAQRNPSIRYVGPVTGRTKALALAASQAIVVTGRVGLVVTDGFAAGRPVLAVADRLHAPEAEYLEPGVTGVLAPTLEALAVSLGALLDDPHRLRSMQVECRARASTYTMTGYAERYLRGLSHVSASSGTCVDPRAD